MKHAVSVVEDLLAEPHFMSLRMEKIQANVWTCALLQPLMETESCFTSAMDQQHKSGGWTATITSDLLSTPTNAVSACVILLISIIPPSLDSNKFCPFDLNLFSCWISWKN